MKVRLANPADAETISNLAKNIWPITYSGIISEEQISFMLEQIYTVESIENQQKNGHQFFILENDGYAQGFASTSAQDNHQYKLQKLYILQNLQGQGAGRLLLTAVEDYCKSKDAKHLVLNVHRNNQARCFYEKMGYQIIETADIPYHHYILNDYIMGKPLT